MSRKIATDLWFVHNLVALLIYCGNSAINNLIAQSRGNKTAPTVLICFTVCTLSCKLLLSVCYLHPD